MPLLNVAVPLGVYSKEEKDAMAAALCDVMTKFRRNEAQREAVWVMIQELERDAYQTNLDFDLLCSTAVNDPQLRASGTIAGTQLVRSGRA